MSTIQNVTVMITRVPVAANNGISRRSIGLVFILCPAKGCAAGGGLVFG